MNATSFDLVVMSLLAIIGLILVIRSRSRVAIDVLEDLKEIDEESLRNDDGSKLALLRANIGPSKLASTGLISISNKSQTSTIRTKVIPILFAMTALFVRVFVSPVTPAGSILTCLIALSLGHFYERARGSKIKNEARRAIDFYLPLVMERLVMAVQAGLDILPAIRSVTELEGESQSMLSNSRLEVNKLDPVSELLRVVLLLCESGLSFEKSLEVVSSRLNIPSLKHAFMHLAVAHREGGELILPLRELSDATQLYYQESIEEEIAGMPVKATMPLLCTFAGLIICFLTSPIIQVMGFMSKGISG